MEMRFVNPYNFIPLGKDTDKQKASYDTYYKQNKLLSGWINMSMYVKTPLLIPDGAHPEYYDVDTGKRIMKPSSEQKKKSHKKYDFYHIVEDGQKRYVVPGSEVRGMVRSMYEAMTDSCFPHLRHDKPMSQRVPTYAAITRRGLLEYNKSLDQWRIWATHADRQKCKIDKGKIYDMNNRECFCGTYVAGKGYLQCNVPVTKKEAYKIAYLSIAGDDPEYSWEVGDKAAYNRLKSALKRDGVTGNQNNPNEVQRKSLLNALEKVNKDGGMIPVRFFVVNRDGEDIVYMSNSSIGRIAQYRKWKEILRGHTPCKSMDSLCPACLLFGTIQDGGAKSKIRFSDGECVDNQVKSEPYLLDILGEPRTSAFEFYLRKPTKDATYWNFDFYGHKVKENGKIANEFDDLKESTPRGRKMYWHGKPVQGQKVSHLNETIEGISEGTQFNFKVYFDQITQKQLEDLIWVITLGENDSNSTMWHKLGHARPLGYGSVKLCADSYCLRTIRHEDGQLKVAVDKETLADKVTCNFDKTSDIYRSVQAMCNATSVKDMDVRYPRYEYKGKDDIFIWFAQNRVMGKNAKGFEALPEPYAEDITLKGSLIGGNAINREVPVENNVESDRPTGTIKMVNTEKGYGFIIRENKDEIFFHYKQLMGVRLDALSVGDRVSFDIGPGNKGVEAKNVRLI